MKTSMSFLITTFFLLSSCTFLQPKKTSTEIPNVNNPNEMYNLGVNLFNGTEYEQNKKRAIQLFLDAAIAGLDNAQYTMGYLNKNGDTLPKNHAKAMEWFMKAALQGMAESQFQVGLGYFNGEGVEQDDLQAYKWLFLARKNGIAEAIKPLRILENRLGKEEIQRAIKDSDVANKKN